MFSIRWFPIFVLLFILGSVLQNPWMTSLPILVGTIVGIAYLWNKYSLARINYHRRIPYKRGFPGELIPIQYEIENNKLLPLAWLRAKDPISLSIAPDDETILAPSTIVNMGNMVNLVNLRWFERIVRNYQLRLRKRGVYQLGPVTLESGDLFGLYTTYQQRNDTEYITIFPQILPISILQLPTDDPFGDRKSPRRLFEDPIQPIGIRSYQTGDDFRRVHWNATAKTGHLQVKVYQPIASQIMVVCFNVTTMEQPWLGVFPELFEQIIKVSTSIVYHAFQEGYAVGLLSNGYMMQSDQTFFIQPGRSRDQLINLLQAMARVTHFTGANFENHLFSSIPKIQYGATVIIVSAFVTNRLLEALLRLKKYRTSITLISLESSPPPYVEGIRMIHIPFEYSSPEIQT